jgi:hypothetical protein
MDAANLALDQVTMRRIRCRLHQRDAIVVRPGVTQRRQRRLKHPTSPAKRGGLFGEHFTLKLGVNLFDAGRGR